jgi:flagella basal body P-ring formation protein FlgA
LTLDAPLKATIRRTGQIVSTEQVRAAVEKAVLSGLSIDKIEARITRLDLPESLLAPAGKLDIHTNFSNIRNPFAKFSLPVEIRVDDRLIRTFAAGVEIEAFADVLVAAIDMAVNTRITETNVKFERKRLVKPLAAYLLDTARLRGAMLIRNVAAGAEITSDTFAAGVVVKYGDTVSLEAVSETIKLIIVAEARGSGKIGDRIAVKNLQSGAILQAVVTDEGHVRVAF